jgi:DNA-binding MarR family transcriptional regulator
LPLALADQISYLLRAAVLRMGRLPPGDGARRDFAVLTALAELAPASQQELADLLAINRTIMVKVVDALEAEGLVARVRDTRDRRRYGLRITGPGDGRRRELETAVDQGDVGVTAPLSQPDRPRLVDLLQRLGAGWPGPRLPPSLWSRAGPLLAIAHRHALRETLAALSPLDLQPRHFGALATVTETPGCSQQHVAVAFGVSEPVAAEVVEELVARDLLGRERDAGDRRLYRLSVTPRGRALVRRARHAVAERDAAFVAPLGDGAPELRRLLRQLRAGRADGVPDPPELYRSPR